jgi:HrpA-like RNA helicase
MRFKFKKLKQLRQNQSNLPVYKYRETILDTIKKHQVTIIAGDTGCGKVKASFTFHKFK